MMTRIFQILWTEDLSGGYGDPCAYVDKGDATGNWKIIDIALVIDRETRIFDIDAMYEASVARNNGNANGEITGKTDTTMTFAILTSWQGDGVILDFGVPGGIGTTVQMLLRVFSQS